MVKAIFTAQGWCLQATSPEAEKALAKLPEGAEVMVEFKRPRNPVHHRKLFSLLRLVIDNQEAYKDEHQLLDFLKIRTGHYDTHMIASPFDGEVEYIVCVPKSISFEAMGQDEFEAVYERFVDVIVGEIIPSIDRDQLLEEVNAMIAFNPLRYGYGDINDR